MWTQAPLYTYEIPFPAVTLEKRGESVISVGIDNSQPFFDATQENFIFFLSF